MNDTSRKTGSETEGNKPGALDGFQVTEALLKQMFPNTIITQEDTMNGNGNTKQEVKPEGPPAEPVPQEDIAAMFEQPGNPPDQPQEDKEEAKLTKQRVWG